jgi:hypothetical protein
LKIAVDIDGVLADQVSAVLERIERDTVRNIRKPMSIVLIGLSRA